jgi:hypothetical protein
VIVPTRRGKRRSIGDAKLFSVLQLWVAKPMTNLHLRSNFEGD